MTSQLMGNGMRHVIAGYRLTDGKEVIGDDGELVTKSESERMAVNER